MINHVLEVPGIREWFDGATNGSGNPDALLLALKIREKIATDIAIVGKLLPNPFSPGRFFTADHLASLANCLQVIQSCMYCRSFASRRLWEVVNLNFLSCILISYAEFSILSATGSWYLALPGQPSLT